MYRGPLQWSIIMTNGSHMTYNISSLLLFYAYALLEASPFHIVISYLTDKVQEGST